MGFRGTQYSKSAYYRRLKKAKALGCSIDEVPDGRGKNKKPSGPDHYRWNNGRIISSEGYAKVRVGKDHPLADPNGYAYEHLLVWVSAGKPRPSKDQILHHRNESKQDNRIDNLRLMNRGVHNAHHNAERGRDAQGRFMPAGRTLDGRTWDEFPEPRP